MFESRRSSAAPSHLGRARELLCAAAAEVAAYAEAEILPGAVEDVGAEIAETVADLERVKFAVCAALGSFERAEGLAGSGYKRLVDWVTHTCVMPRAEAYSYARIAQRPAALGESEEAYRGAEISLGQLERISEWSAKAAEERNRTAWPDEDVFVRRAEAVLLGLACQESTTCEDLRVAGRKLRYQLNPATHEREYRQRYDFRGATFARTRDNGFHFEAWGDEVSADALQAALEAFGSPPQPADERRPRQRLFDQLIDMADFALKNSDRLPLSGGERAQVRLVVSLETLQGAQGALPVQSDYGTVYPVSATRALAKDCLLRRIVTDPLTGRPLDVGRAERIFPLRSRIALTTTHSTCQWEDGCDRPARWCQIDHHQAWYEGGATDIDNGRPLCRRHNLEKEHRRAAGARERHPTTRRRRHRTRPARAVHPPGDPPDPPAPTHSA